MSYVFLIIVISSHSSNMNVIPMESIEQCNAAIMAMDVASQKRKWNDVSPKVDNIQCVEVKPDAKISSKTNSACAEFSAQKESGYVVSTPRIRPESRS